MPNAPSAAQRQLDAFVALAKKAVSEARKHAQPVANSSVVVDRTGKSYPTINAALASITDASQQKIYVLLIGEGGYNEVVVCKPWVILSGAGRGKTYISVLGEPNAPVPAVITAASHVSVQDCTVRATTMDAFGPVTAIRCQGALDFDVENCELLAIAQTGSRADVFGMMVDSGNDGSELHVNISYTTVTATGGGKPTGIRADNGAYAHGMQSTFVADKGSVPGVGGVAANGATLLVENCTVQGAGYSLYKEEGPSGITTNVTANQCTLNGPVGPGVVVNP